MPLSSTTANANSDPAYRYAAVVTSDSIDLSATDGPFRALFVGVGGNVVVEGVDGVAATFKNVPSGSVLPVRGKKVKATGTTATDIITLR